MSGSLAERYRNLKLRTKFVFHIGVSVALLRGAGPASCICRDVPSWRTHARGPAAHWVFAHASVQAVVADDFLVLLHLINSIASDPDVLYAMVLDRSGRTLVHSDMSETGRTYTDPLSQQAVAAERPSSRRCGVRVCRPTILPSPSMS
jgi:hypothetical protein